MNDAVHCRLRGQKSSVPTRRRLRLVVVQIAVTDMPECDDAKSRKRLGQRLVGTFHELWNARYRYRDIVLDAQSVDSLRLPDIFTQGP